jgi:VWFA-related protein
MGGSAMETQLISERRVGVNSVRKARKDRVAISRLANRLAAVFLSAGLFTLAAWAQSQAPPPPQQSQDSQQKSASAQDAQTSRPALKVISQMVQVDVIAKDRNGQPVKDLTQKDFTIYDNGKKQDIAWFSLETDKTKNMPAAAVSPDTYSNLVEKQSGVPGNLTIILLDFLNTKQSDVNSARNQVIKLLRTMKPEDRVAVYALARRLYVLHDFTNDSAALERSIQKYATPASADQLAGVITNSFSVSDANGQSFDIANDNFLNQAYQSMSDFASIDRVFTTVQVFEIISQHMIRVPGRKNLIWVSGSFPYSIDLDYDREGSPYSNAFSGPGALSIVPVGGQFGTVADVHIGGNGNGLALGASTTGAGGPFISEPRSFGDEIQAATRALTNANIAMYPVDTHGLVAPSGDYSIPSEYSITGTSMETMPIVGGDPATTPGSMLSTNFDTMENLAQHTGGLAFTSTNDIGGAVKKAMEDGAVSYMIAYYPTQDDGKEKFHNIKLKVSRPGVDIRYRNGYYAEPLNYEGITNTAPIIRQALTSPLDATGLGMTIHAKALNANGARMLGLTLDVEQSDVSFKYDDGKTVGTVKVVLAQFDVEGNEIAGETTTVKMQLSKDTYGTVRKDGLRFRRNLPLLPNAVELKVVACDDRSSAVGSVSIPIAKYFPPAGK